MHSLCLKCLPDEEITYHPVIPPNAQKLEFRFLDASSHLYKRVCPFVRPSVTLSSKTRKINIFEQINAQAGIIGSLDASLYLYKTICWSVGQSINLFITLPRISMKIGGFHQIKKSRRISCNHVIIQSFNQI